MVACMKYLNYNQQHKNQDYDFYTQYSDICQNITQEYHLKKTNPKITILEILVNKIQPEIMKSKIFTRFNFITKPCPWLGFGIKLKRVKILDLIISGCILYTKISRMVIFGLDFLVYFLKLSVGNGFWNIILIKVFYLKKWRCSFQ